MEEYIWVIKGRYEDIFEPIPKKKIYPFKSAVADATAMVR